MKITKLLLLCAGLAGCATSLTMPAAVRMHDGRVLVGTTTASTSGGTFEATEPTTGLRCTGTYDALDMRPTITAPVMCTDGRTGVLTVTRTEDFQAGSGSAAMSDGTTATVAFGRLATTVMAAPPPIVAVVAPPLPAVRTQPSYTPTRPISRRTSFVGSSCPCSSSRNCIGPRGGRYCITSGGNKRYR